MQSTSSKNKLWFAIWFLSIVVAILASVLGTKLWTESRAKELREEYREVRFNSPDSCDTLRTISPGDQGYVILNTDYGVSRVSQLWFLLDCGQDGEFLGHVIPHSVGYGVEYVEINFYDPTSVTLDSSGPTFLLSSEIAFVANYKLGFGEFSHKGQPLPLLLNLNVAGEHRLEITVEFDHDVIVESPSTDVNTGAINLFGPE